MVTGSQSDIVKPVDHLSLHMSSISHIPKSPFPYLKYPHWCNAMYDEYNATLSRYKACLVANGSTPGFVDSWYPHHVCLLQRSLYGLKQAPRTWFQRIAGYATWFLSQQKYALQLLECAHMVNCNPSRTLVDTESKLGPIDVLVQDPTLYHSLVGGL
ncbi:ribonuclease H-like domain-containing protein [Tanacetum coccineum]